MMLLKFHQYFEERNDIKIFLKYDGERDKNVFTVMIVDVSNSDNTLMKNTDNLLCTFSELTVKSGINVSGETNDLLINTFLRIKSSLIKKYSNKLVFVLTVEYKECLEYYVSIQYDSIMKNFRDKDFNRIIEFLELENTEY
jgi:hypothetical protein